MTGDSARAVTATALSTLDDDWCVMTGVGWPGRDGTTVDHVVVGPGGVFVIDSRHWSGRLDVHADGLRQNGRLRNDATSGATSAAHAVSAMLDLDIDAVHPVLCLVREEDLSGWAGDVFVTTSQDLAVELSGCPLVLGPDEVARLRGLVASELPSPTPGATAEPDRRELHREPAAHVAVGRHVSAEEKPETAPARSRRTMVSGLVGLIVIVVSVISVAVLTKLGDTEAPRTQTSGALGDTIDIDGAKSRPDLQLTAAKVLPAKGVDARPRKGMRLVVVRFKIDNVGDQRYAGRGLMPAVIDATGTTYGPVDRVTHVSTGPLLPDRVHLRAGRSVRGWVVFELPRRADIDTVTLSVEAGAQTATWSASQGA
jgi:hypothetical protein